MQAWFVSDIHIKEINERSSVTLLRFLNSIASGDREATHIFLVGDIFDLWVGDSKYFIKKYQPIIQALNDIKNKGVEVIYFEGNHDVHIKSVWKKLFGIDVFVEPKTFQLGQLQVRVEHGDYINPDDVKYLKYREFIRQPVLERFADYVPGSLLHWIGNYASKKSRKSTSKMRIVQEEHLRQLIRNYAKNVYQVAPYDYLITGHMHVRDEYHFNKEKKEAISINLGSWFNEPKVLLLQDSGYEWVEL